MNVAGSQVGSGDTKRSVWERLLEAVASWLIHPLLPLHLSLTAMILMLPALWVGFQLDDYYYRMVMLGMEKHFHPGPYSFLNAFSFLNGDPSTNDALRGIGVLPWWASSHLRISFFRPLSAFTIWIDNRFWPNWPTLMHLQSILWYGGLIVAVTLFYRRIMGITVIAGLAALFYAVDFSHAFPVSWLANRNAILAVFFGVLCLLSYDRWRREGNGRHGVMSAVYLALALLSGEMALATAGYLFAYALFLDREKWGRRLTALWPCALVFVVWGIGYRILGFGTHGSGFYVDPADSPVAFAKVFITRVPLLLMGQWSHISADSVVLMLLSKKAAFIFASFVIVLLAVMLFSLVRKDRIARFWLTGMLLSLVPVAGTEPSNRLLFFVGLGAMGLLAQFIVHLRRNDGVLPLYRGWRTMAFVFAAYLIVVRLLVSPVMMPVGAYMTKFFGDSFAHAAGTIPDDARIARQDLIIVNSPHTLTTSLIWYVRTLEGKALPARIRELSGGGGPVEVYRIDGYSLRVRTPEGLFGDMFSRLWRSPEDEPITVNQEFLIPGVTVRVTRVGKDGPEEMVYRFSVPIDDPSLKWLQWKNQTYMTFVPPAIGESVSLPPFYMRELYGFGNREKELKGKGGQPS